ncbi:hypothetical protein BZG35_07125 [Brevundimonas sp. LM2]|nr:hypothetical protein BZG35_07125 [Brevundimonas sp. LM2]
MTSASNLLQLARGKTADDRRRLLQGIADLCNATPPGAEASPLLGEIFMIIARQAEQDIRKVLSESLASTAWAPPALITMLALDAIEIARPVIAASPLLKDQDLLRVLVEATLEHQIEVARRPRISSAVADAIIDRGDPAILTALAGNRTAQISEAALGRLIAQSQRIAALRAPLTRHPRLNEALATELFLYVGQALQEAIRERFQISEARLAAAVDAAVRPPLAEPIGIDDALVIDHEEMERRLVEKLDAAGQLRPGFLIRAIREKRLSLFQVGLATLCGFSLDQVRAAIERRDPEALFLLCAAAGIDRAVFSAVVQEIRALSGGWPGHGDGQDQPRPALSPSAAARAFRALIGGAEA